MFLQVLSTIGLTIAFCAANHDDIFLHLATKTGYRFIANMETTKIEFEGCETQKVWALIRHGTRNPSEEFIITMQKRLTNVRDLILNNNSDLEKYNLHLLKKWKPSVDASQEKELTSEGAEELVALGERMQARFPQLLPPVYSNTSYQFKFTQTSRTELSAINFAIGLFGKNTAKDVWFPEASKRDPILRFYKLCNKWRKEVKKNPNALIELKEFKRSSMAEKVVRDIEKKLNLEINTLTFDDLQHMFTTCAFETAWNEKPSPWCNIFDSNNIKILEYAEDLKYYWIDGYGFNITYEQACPAFGNMINHFESSDKYPRAIFYFTHSGTILKMLAHLGLYKDEEHLMHQNYNENRKWKVSKIDTFASNIAFIFFKCGDERKLLLMHQERIVRFPCCPSSDLCDFSKVREFYQNSIEKCTFDEICRNL